MKNGANRVDQTRSATVNEEMAYERLVRKVEENKTKRKITEESKVGKKKKRTTNKKTISSTEETGPELDADEVGHEKVQFEEEDNIMEMALTCGQSMEFPSEEELSEAEDGEITEITGCNYKARHTHKRLYTVLPKYSKIQVLPGITS